MAESSKQQGVDAPKLGDHITYSPYASECSQVDTNDMYQDWFIQPHSMSIEKHEVLGLTEEDNQQVVEIPNFMDETRMFSDSSDNGLGDFLSRPLKIAEFVWTPSIAFYESFNPWSLFINNKRNVNRLNNYRMFRSKLKMKILINGNSFFYGRLMSCYQPFAQIDNLTANTALVPEDNIQMSQMPRFFIDPTTSQGGEMTLPFFWPYDYCDLTTEDYDYLGTVTIRELTSLKHTSGDVTLSNQLNVTVYAWMEDVSLEGPTHSNMATIVPQSEKDERKDAQKGPVEKVATAVEAVSKKLSVIPQLAPFATPAAIGAGAVKGIASTFGWCQPTIVEAPSPYKPTPCANTATVTGADTTQKLSLDCKNEITVDPRTLGLGTQDELDIAHIASRESYIGNFPWAIGTAAETHLWNSRVDPYLFDVAVVGGKVTHFLSAMAGASVPFQYWNGSITFRFQIVASTFHRGRLAIVYDPDATAAVREDNVAYTEIVDIATCRDFSITIGPNQTKTLMPRGAVDEFTVPYGTSPIVATPSYGNGTIAVYVLNELTIPNSDTLVNNDISVNVFANANEDFEVFVPSADFTKFVIKPQSETIDQAQITESSYSTPNIDLGMDSDFVKPSRNLVYTGEQIKSFRALLKRYYPWRGINMPTNALSTQCNLWEIQHCNMPAYRGNVVGALDSRVGPVDYSFVTTTLINFLLPAFQAYRGSTRWKALRRGKGSYDMQSCCSTVALNFDGRYSSLAKTIGNSQFTTARETVSEAEVGTFQDSCNGTVIFANSVNPVLEYELPWYSNERFCAGKRSNFTSQIRAPLFPQTGATIHVDAAASAEFYYQLYVAAGEDFSMYFFTGWPRMYVEITVPLSA